MSKEVLLDVRHLTQQFHLTKKIKVKAVDDVSFRIHKGEIFGLVGESGSGKSTVARCLMNIYQPAQGEIWYKDVNICDKKEFKKHKKMLHKEGNSKAVTLQELANEFGVSAERIRQIEKLAIQKMRQTLEQAHYSE